MRLWQHHGSQKQSRFVAQADNQSRFLFLNLIVQESPAHCLEDFNLGSRASACGRRFCAQSQVGVREKTLFTKPSSLDQGVFDAPRPGFFKSPGKALFESRTFRIGIVLAAEIIAQNHDSANRERRGIGTGWIISPESISTGKESLSFQDSWESG